MTGSDENLRALERWFAKQWPAARDIRCEFVGSPKTGMSNDSKFASVYWSEAGGARTAKYVLRRAVDTLEIHPPQVELRARSTELQHGVMVALVKDGGIPAPKVLPLERDATWLGAPFFLMEFVSGVTLSDFPNFNEQGPFVDATPAIRSSMYDKMLRHLAALHRIDWKKAGVGWLDRSAGGKRRCPSQMELWNAYCAPIFERDSFPTLRAALSFLSDNFPAEPAPSLTWGDPRPQNFLFDADLKPLILMDWEGAAILPAEVDLTYWIWNDYFAHERVGVARRDGVPSRQQQIEMYQVALGRPLHALHYYRVLSLMTIVATMYNVYDLLAAKGISMGPDERPSDNFFCRTLQAALDGKELW